VSAAGVEEDSIMPKIKAAITIHYEQQGSGEPLILIPYLAADHACYAFQVAEFAKHFTCISLDLRGTGESENSTGPYTTETLADDVVGFMDALGIARAHLFGLSLGAAVSLWMGAKYPEKVSSLSLHGAWTKTDPYIRAVLEAWRIMARALSNVQETVIRGLFPWCFTPELYAARPEYIQALSDFVRSRPAQSVESFLLQSDAAMNHDVQAQLARIKAPTQVTFGRYDMVTGGFIDRLKNGIADCETHIFDGCSHAALYEHVDEFNAKVLEFLQRRARAQAA
jgi:pimeloyl-ACP methyl ester carboxylesterase